MTDGVSSKSFLLKNAWIYTKMLPAPTAILIRDGRIAWLGQDDQVSQFDDIEHIDCQGHWLAPAFADAHVHVTNTGIELTGLHLKDCASARELEDRLRKFITPEHLVVIGHGWDDSRWPERPTSGSIDVNVPVYLSRVDVHSALINNALVARCPEITALAGWDGSGRVTQDAHALARKTAFGLLSVDAKDLARREMLQECARLGIVAVDEMAGPIVSSESDAQKVLTLGTHASHPEVFVWWGELFGFETARDLGALGCGGDLFVDGSLGSRTACLHDPYLEGGHGVSYISAEDIARHIDLAQTTSMPTSFHAIGDAAIDRVIEGFADAALRYGADSVRRLNHRIEHAEMTSPSHFSIAGNLNIGLSVQPQFDALWAGDCGMYAQRIGDRQRQMNNFAGMGAAGAPLLLGSDAPVTNLNPWQSISAATATHEPSHSLSKRLAFANHTRSFWRHRSRVDIGVIEVGNVASLALWQVPEFDESGNAGGSTERAQKWSLDPRSGLTPLPNLNAGLPTVLQAWKYGMPMLSDALGSSE